jgi:hypothetical protein
MRPWQYTALIAAGVLCILGIVYLIPQTQFIALWAINAIKGLVVFVLILAAGGILGWLVKAYAVASLDDWLTPEDGLSTPQHWMLSIVLGVLVGLIHVSMMPMFMAWQTWVRELAFYFDWSGVFETLPVFWFFWTGIWCMLIYMAVPYKIGETETKLSL